MTCYIGNRHLPSSLTTELKFLKGAKNVTTSGLNHY